VVVPWWIASEGGAPDLAVYGMAMSAMAFAAMPLLSPLGDRYAKRRLIALGLLAFAVAAVGVAVLASAGHYRIGLLVVIELVPVIAIAVIWPASNSLSAELVPAAQLSSALSLQQSAQSTGRMIGPALAGAVLVSAGIAAALWLHALLLLVAAALAMRLPRAVKPEADEPVRKAWWSELRAGVKANWAIPLERGWTLVNFMSWIFLFPALTMLVPLKVQSLGLSAMWLGLCEAALSVGMLLGAVGLSEKWVAWQGRYATRISASMLQCGALAVAGWTAQPWLLVTAFALAGVTNSAMMLVGMTHRMLARPPAFRARMSAGAMMTSQVAGTLGPAIAGVALTHWPVDTVYLVFGLLAAVASAGLLIVPGFRAFMALGHEEVEGWYGRAYPLAFGNKPKR
jgi:MFS family permease